MKIRYPMTLRHPVTRLCPRCTRLFRMYTRLLCKSAGLFYTALLRKITFEDKVSYDFTPNRTLSQVY